MWQAKLFSVSTYSKSSYNFKGKIFYVNQNMTCEVQNVIYVITCNGCGEYCIGQTGGKLRTRRTVYAQQIRDPSTRMIPLKCSSSNLLSNRTEIINVFFFLN